MLLRPAPVLRPALRSWAGLLVFGLVGTVGALAIPQDAWSQEPRVEAEDPEVQESEAQRREVREPNAEESEPALQVSLLAGSRGLGDRAHPFAGLEGSAHHGRFGLAATGHLGSGSDYSSTLFGIGPSVRLLRAASTRLSVWAGVSRYREELDRGLLPPGSGPADRSVTGGLLGVTLRRPLPLGSLSLHATWLAGRLDGDDVVVPHRIQGLRLAVGIGR